MDSVKRREKKKNRHLCFWIVFGIIILILAAAAICIPLGISLVRNAGSNTTQTTTTTRGKYVNCKDIDFNFV